MNWEPMVVMALIVIWAALGTADLILTRRRKRLEKEQAARAMHVNVVIPVETAEKNLELACTSALDQVLQQVLPDDPDAQCRVLDTLWYQAYSQIEDVEPVDQERLH